MKSFVVSVLGFAAVAMAGTSAVNADTATFAVGEWAPYIGEALPDKGPHAKRVSDVFSGAGYDVKFEFTPWKRASESTKRGDLPATFSWGKTDDRQKDFLFPEEPVEVLKTYIYFRKDKFPDGVNAKSYQDLKDQGLKLVAIGGYSQVEEMKSVGGEVHEVKSAELAWKFLHGGRADVFLAISAVADVDKEKVLGGGAGEIAQSADPMFERPLYIMFSKQHPDGAKLLDVWNANAK